jgi:hypothetical protein
MIVPKGKRVYTHGTRRFIEGDIIPPYLQSEPEVIVTTTKPKRKKSKNVKRKKSDLPSHRSIY